VGLRAIDRYQYEDAERAFQAALAEAPDYTMARYRLALAMAAGGKTDDALLQARKAKSEISRLSEREALYVTAAEAHFARRSDEALQQYAKLLERYPYEVEARYSRASIFLETRDYDHAIAEANLVTRLAPENHSIWALLGAAHLAKKDFEHAAVALRKYTELEPGSPNAHEMLADFYRSQAELDLAAGQYRQALELDPRFGSSAVSLGVVDALRGRLQEAERGLRAVAQNASALPTYRTDAAKELAYVLRAQGRFRDSIRALESVERLFQNEKVFEALELSVRGLSRMEIGEYKEAERLTRLAIQRTPGVSTRYLFARALFELRMNRPGDVQKTISKILEQALPPSDPDRTEEKAAAYLRSLILLAEKKPAEARQALSPALSLEGHDYAIYRIALAQAYWMEGNLPDAFAAAKKATGPLDPVTPQLELELDRVRGLLLLAEIQKAMGNPTDAARLARQFLQIWASADSNLPEVARAKSLATPTISEESASKSRLRRGPASWSAWDRSGRRFLVSVSGSGKDSRFRAPGKDGRDTRTGC
jgi:tetratricopeptide (TPR) repeat protein